MERARGRVIRQPLGDIEICNPLIRWLTRGVGYLSKEGRDVRVMGRFKIDKRFVLSNSVLHRSDAVQFTERSISFGDAGMVLGPRQTRLGKRYLPIK